MNILIIEEVDTILVDKLNQLGYHVDYEPTFSYQQTLDNIYKYDGLIVRGKFFIDKNIITKGKQLKFLARAGVGLDIFDLQEAENNNIKIINAAGANANAVAEHTLGLMLAVFHNINRASSQVKNFEWLREENRGDELSGKTIGIIGYGNTGKALAKKIKAFDCKILAFDKYLQNYSDAYVQEASLQQIYEEADVLTLHIPLTDETLGLCDSSFFSRFKKNFYFFNTSRGKITNTTSLLENLNNGKIKGAGLDVLENEHFDELTLKQKELYKQLFKNQQVIVTPHIAGWSYQSFIHISEILAEKIKFITN